MTIAARVKSAPSTLFEPPHVSPHVPPHVPLHARIQQVLRARIERLTHDARHQLIDFEYLYFRADTFQYRLRIDRQRQGQRQGQG